MHTTSMKQTISTTGFRILMLEKATRKERSLYKPQQPGGHSLADKDSGQETPSPPRHQNHSVGRQQPDISTQADAIIPHPSFLTFLYLISFLDRTNIGMLAQAIAARYPLSYTDSSTQATQKFGLTN
jgi:hypothetical protein